MRLTRRQFLLFSGSAVLLPSLLPNLLAAAPKGTIPVLMYHDITDKFRDPYSISPALFAAQMEWLYAAGYRAVSLSDAANLPLQGERVVVITFDDGYATFMDYAFPLLREYGFKATLNVIGEYAGRVMRYIGARPMLSWDEYRFIARSGFVDLGCHTSALLRGRGVLNYPPAALEHDLNSFRERLADETGVATDILAWPFGSYTDESMLVAEKVGFRFVLTSEEGYFSPTSTLKAIPRLNVAGSMKLGTFRDHVIKGN